MRGRMASAISEILTPNRAAFKRVTRESYFPTALGVSSFNFL